MIGNKSERVKKILLLDDPDLSLEMVAKKAGCSTSLVMQVKTKLGKTNAKMSAERRKEENLIRDFVPNDAVSRAHQRASKRVELLSAIQRLREQNQNDFDDLMAELYGEAREFQTEQS